MTIGLELVLSTPARNNLNALISSDGSLIILKCNKIIHNIYISLDSKSYNIKIEDGGRCWKDAKERLWRVWRPVPVCGGVSNS